MSGHARRASRNSAIAEETAAQATPAGYPNPSEATRSKIVRGRTVGTRGRGRTAVRRDQRGIRPSCRKTSPLSNDEEGLEEDLNSLTQAGMEARMELANRSAPGGKL